MCDYICVGFIGYMFKDNALTDFTGPFLPDNFLKNGDIILDNFLTNL